MDSNFYLENQKALGFLSKGNFKEAQILFFNNAKQFKNHEAYNNLGVYLCNEGLECKNGKVRNADKLGFLYLLKAQKSKTTSVNLNNIANEIYKQGIRHSSPDAEIIETYRTAYKYLNVANHINYSDETEYNRLVFCYLIDPNNTEVLDKMTELALKTKDEDSIEFWLHTLCKHSMFIECLDNIKNFENKLDEVCLMILYYLCGEYGKAALFFESICEKFYLDAAQIAFLVDCLTKKNQSYKLLDYKMHMLNTMCPDEQSVAKQFISIINKVFDNENYRAELITRYSFRPKLKKVCGYFGCKTHKTSNV